MDREGEIVGSEEVNPGRLGDGTMVESAEDEREGLVEADDLGEIPEGGFLAAEGGRPGNERTAWAWVERGEAGEGEEPVGGEGWGLGAAGSLR